MTGKVWITINGIRTVDGEQEPVDEAGWGDYYQKNGKHYIIWRHNGNMAKRIRITKDSMTVTETNGGNVMDFEKGRETRTLYGISEGRLALKIQTHEFSMREEEALLEAKVEYSLYHEDCHMSDNCIKVKICPQNAQ